MTTPTPKRKRGQHRARHPWSKVKKRKPPEAFNDDDCRRWDEFTKFTKSKEGIDSANDMRSIAIYHYFMAGYRAGKDAK